MRTCERGAHVAGSSECTCYGEPVQTFRRPRFSSFRRPISRVVCAFVVCRPVLLLAVYVPVLVARSFASCIPELP